MGYGLRADGIAVFGSHRKAIVEDVDLEIAAGSFVAIIGASGAGKSTVLKALGLRLPNRRRGDLGTLSLLHDSGASPVTRDNHDDLLALLSYVPQADIFVDGLTAGETLRQACTFSGSDDDGRVADLLAAVGLGDDTAEKRIVQLSGGQKRRLSIARALASDPALLLLDEPTSGLDLPVANEVMALLESLSKRGITVVCTSHQPSTLGVCDRVLVIAPGRVIADHSPQSFAATDVAEVYKTETELPPLAEAPPAAAFPATPDCGHWRADHFLAVLKRRLTGGGLIFQAAALGAIVVLTQLLHGGDATRFIDFFLSVCALWIGMTASVRAFVSERLLFAVDEIGGLTRGSYFTAKVADTCLRSLVGVIVLTAAAYVSVHAAGLFADVELTVRDFGFDGLARLPVLFVTGISGAMIGLLISALARTEGVAIALMPLALLPQVVFSRYACGYSNRTPGDDGFPYQALEHGAAGAYNNPLEMLNFFASLPMSTRHASWALDGGGLLSIDFGALGLLVAVQCFLAYLAFVSTSNRWLTMIR